MKTKGFALIELAIVMVVFSLLMGGLAQMYASLNTAQVNQQLSTQMLKIDQALASFVAANRRLPCPANGTIASYPAPGANDGVENPVGGSCTYNSEANGVVPWITLGLTENDVTDPWGGRITYRVDPYLTVAPQVLPQVPPLTFPDTNAYSVLYIPMCDLFGNQVQLYPSPAPALAVGQIPPSRSPCQPSAILPSIPTLGNPCSKSTGSCTPLVPTAFYGFGLKVTDGSGVQIYNAPVGGTGAAYVTVSHGPSGAGAMNSGGVLQPGTLVTPLSQAALPLEWANANGALGQPPSATAVYIDATYNDSTAPVTALHFDDAIHHPSIQTVIGQAGFKQNTN